MTGAAPDHQRRKTSNAVENTAQVGVHHGVPDVGGKLMQWTGPAADTGIVDENIEPPESALHSLGHRFHRPQIGDIAFHDGTLPTLVANGCVGAFQRFAGASTQHSVRAQASERDGDGRANPASSAGNDRDLPRQG